MWPLADRWAGRMFTVVAFVIVARNVSPEEASQLAWFVFLMTFSGLVAEAGIAAPLINERGRPTRSRTADTEAISRWAAGALFVSTLIAALIALYSGEPNWGLALVVLAFGHLAIPRIAVTYALAARDLNFKALAHRRIASQSVGAAVALGMVFAGLSLFALPSQYVVASAVSRLALTKATDYDAPKMSLVVHDKRLIGQGLRALGASTIAFLGMQAYVLSLPWLGDSETGGQVVLALILFSVAQDLSGNLMGAVSWPVMARLLRAESSRAELGRVVLTCLRLATAASLLAIAVVLTCFELLLGPGWSEARILLLGMLTCLPALTWVQMHRAYLSALGRFSLEVRLTAISVGAVSLLFAGSIWGATYVAVGVAFIARAVVMVLLRLPFRRQSRGMGGVPSRPVLVALLPLPIVAMTLSLGPDISLRAAALFGLASALLGLWILKRSGSWRHFVTLTDSGRLS